MLDEIKNNSDKIEYLVENSASYIPDHNLVMNCAALAADVYNDSGSPPGWQRFAQIKTDSGYFGAVYISPKRRGPVGLDVRDVYFASRGTSSVLDVIADISVVSERPFQQIYDAVNFVSQITKKLGTHGYMNFYHTGHSLGAIMSDICASFMCYSDSSKFMHGRSITFENPGSKNIAAQAYPKLIAMFPHTGNNIEGASAQSMLNMMPWNSCAYQSPINIINSCNEQAGTLIRLVDKEHHIDQDYAKSCVNNPFSITAAWEGNLAYWKINTLDQHLINPIIDYLKANRRQVVENNSVHGLQPTYKEFLNVATNGKYWNDYFLAIWNNSSEPKDEFSQFLKYGLDEIKSAHDYNGFVMVPNFAEKQSLFAVKPKELDVVPTPYDNKSYCSIM